MCYFGLEHFFLLFGTYLSLNPSIILHREDGNVPRLYSILIVMPTCSLSPSMHEIVEMGGEVDNLNLCSVHADRSTRFQLTPAAFQRLHSLVISHFCCPLRDKPLFHLIVSIKSSDDIEESHWRKQTKTSI